VLGQAVGQPQVVDEDLAGFGQVGVVFRRRLVRLGRGVLLLFVLDFLEQLFALGLASGVFQGQCCCSMLSCS